MAARLSLSVEMWDLRVFEPVRQASCGLIVGDLPPWQYLPPSTDTLMLMFVGDDFTIGFVGVAAPALGRC